MWLPKDERTLLRLYYKKIGEPEKPEFINEIDLIKTLSPNCDTQSIEGVPGYADSKLRVSTANKVLSERKLVRYREAGKAIEINLSVEGYDLGRKYDFWWLRSNLWYTEYIKHHWIYVVAGFLGGILSHWLLSRFVR